MAQSEFRRDLEALINFNSMENGSRTPDFILADYLMACLAAFDAALQAREKWWARPFQPTIGGEVEALAAIIEQAREAGGRPAHE